MKRRIFRGFIVCFAIVFSVIISADWSTAGDSGIYGRAAWRGELVSGITVFAYNNAKSNFNDDEFSRSEATSTEGTYRMSLPPGRYTLVARSSGAGEDGRPGAGDYYCFYSGSPVVVREGQWAPVGFNLVKFIPEERHLAEERYPAEEKYTNNPTVIEGTITYQDEPLEKLYLNLYTEPSEGFRGPGLAAYPVGSGGRFRINISPGKYFVIARKRIRGGMYGPMEIGDYFNYYPGNPIVIEKGENVKLTIETVTRLSQLEEGLSSVPAINGRVVESSGQPVMGVRVFAYGSGITTGRPDYFSEPSDEGGHFSLSIPEPGDYSLVAREKFGGPAGPGEYNGVYLSGNTVAVGTDDGENDVTITVGKQK